MNLVVKFLAFAPALTFSPLFGAFGDNFYNNGHADLGLALEDGDELFLHFHAEDSGPPAIINGQTIAQEAEFEPSDITLLVPSNTLSVAPNDNAFATGTGVAAGGDIWIIPQSNTPNLPFLGFGTEELDPNDWIGQLTFSLGTVISPSGSGNFSVYQGDGFGGFNFLISTSDSGATPGQVQLNAGVEDHFDIAFSEPGEWLIEFTASGEHITLGSLSDTETFNFTVIPEPSHFSIILGGFAVVLRRFCRRVR